jgi:hypothetical protein
MRASIASARSGTPLSAVLIDLAAKVLATNLASLMYIAAAKQAALPTVYRRFYRAYAVAPLQGRLPCPVHFFPILADMLRLLCANIQRFIAGRSRPRPVHQVKLYPSAVCKR